MSQSTFILRERQSSIINNTMLFQITLLAWLFLCEQLTWPQLIGMILAVLGTLAVQIRKEA